MIYFWKIVQQKTGWSLPVEFPLYIMQEEQIFKKWIESQGQDSLVNLSPGFKSLNVRQKSNAIWQGCSFDWLSSWFKIKSPIFAKNWNYFWLLNDQIFLIEPKLQICQLSNTKF